MKRLIDALVDDTDFFIEQVQLTAIVFDNSDDVTIWATTHFDNEAHFFHLGLPFQRLDLLLRLAGPRSAGLQEDVADALSTVQQWPCLLEYSTEESPPVSLPNVALKLSCTYPADDLFGDGEEFGEAEFSQPDAEEREEENQSFDISTGISEEDDADYESTSAHNIFYLEDVFLRVV